MRRNKSIRALEQALREGATPELKEVACEDPVTALRWALLIDGGEPSPETRFGASKNATTALEYLVKVDKGNMTPAIVNAILSSPSASLRAFRILGDKVFYRQARKNPRIALWLAQHYGGTDSLRRYASKNPITALHYAISVDGKPHDVTRKGACQNPYTAVGYALFVDGQAREDTLQASLQDSLSAYYYAKYLYLTDNPALREHAFKGATGRLFWSVVIDRQPPSDEVVQAVFQQYNTTSTLRSLVRRLVWESTNPPYPYIFSTPPFRFLHKKKTA